MDVVLGIAVTLASVNSLPLAPVKIAWNVNQRAFSVQCLPMGTNSPFPALSNFVFTKWMLHISSK